MKKGETGKRPSSSNECVERNFFIYRLRKKGVPFEAIGRLFGISKNRVIKIYQTIEKKLGAKLYEIRN